LPPAVITARMSFPLSDVRCEGRDKVFDNMITRTHDRQHGFSMIEMMVVVILLLILSAMVIPSGMIMERQFRVGSDTRAIAAQLNLARMRAAAGYTHARVYMDLSGNTYRLQVWNKSGGCWQTDGGSSDCPQTTSPVTGLSSGGTYGFGSLTAGPTAATSTTAQSPVCTTGVAGASPGTNISNTACIEFNSRTYPVNSSNTIVASDAIYLTNNSQFFSAIAVSISGQPTAYRYSGSSWAAY
jgi:prepilin-type N-terminal cleavage/methylation domain-containing protein